MSYNQTVLLTPGSEVQVPIPNPSNVAAIKLSNGTRYDLYINGFGTQGTLTIPNGTEYLLSGSVQNSGFININPIDNYGVGGNGIVNINVFLFGDPVPQGSWPTTIPAQVVSVANAQTLFNTTQAFGSQIVKIRYNGNTSNQDNISMDNDGTVNIFQTPNNTPVLIFQVEPGAGAVAGSVAIGPNDNSGSVTLFGIVDVSGGPFNVLSGGATISGGATVNGGETVNGTLTTNGNVTQAGAANTVTINGILNAVDNGSNNYFQLSPTSGQDVTLSLAGKTCAVLGQLTVAQNLVTSSDVFINSGSLHFRNSQTLTRVFYGTGNGNGTITHNVGINPTLVIITYNTGATQAACPAWTNASTNVVNVFAAAVPWSAMCIWS